MHVTDGGEIRDELPDDLLNARQALAVDDFFAFGGYPYPNPTGEMVEGNLEQGFHNNVHNWIGGNMASFALAGFEPLFPAHHNNIDRLWAAWVARRGSDALPDDPAWRARRYQFVNEQGKLESVQVRDLLDDAAIDLDFLSPTDPITPNMQYAYTSPQRLYLIDSAGGLHLRPFTFAQQQVLDRGLAAGRPLAGDEQPARDRGQVTGLQAGLQGAYQGPVRVADRCPEQRLEQEGKVVGGEVEAAPPS